MNLFEINDKILNAFRIDEETIVDGETGEVFDSKYLDELEMMREEKITNIGRWIKNLNSDIEQLDAQKKYFEKRKKAAENKRDSLKEYLTAVLNGQKFEAEDKSVKITFTHSKSVNVLDEKSIPKKWFIAQPPKIDKAGMKEQLKLGKKIKGVELAENENIQIK